jgi:ABC-type nickel/cobalt efflux system permease component RcnA
MTSFLLLGILLGLRHALEADHLAAVAALATRQRGLGRTVLQGAAWGAGHGAVLLAVGGVCLLFRLAVPEQAARLLEAGVGVMLIALGWGVLRRVVRRRVHVHLHRHDDGTVHLHAHRHAAEEAHDPERHRHAHAERLPWRAVGVGMLHGLAGSAALLLLVASTLASPAVSLLYIACFGAGAVLGMAALSAAISLPLRHTAGLLGGAHNTLETLVGLGALGIGVWVVYAAAGTS